MLGDEKRVKGKKPSLKERRRMMGRVLTEDFGAYTANIEDWTSPQFG
jgi:hypothetical protein